MFRAHILYSSPPGLGEQLVNILCFLDDYKVAVLVFSCLSEPNLFLKEEEEEKKQQKKPPKLFLEDWIFSAPPLSLIMCLRQSKFSRD